MMVNNKTVQDSGTAALAAEQSAWKLPDLSHLPGHLDLNMKQSRGCMDASYLSSFGGFVAGDGVR